MTDLPPGEWTPLLIGDHWPSSSSLAAVSASANSRRTLSTDFNNYVELLLRIKRQSLDPQQGVTADDARGAFDRGTTHSDQIAHANNVKSAAYLSVHDKVTELRAALSHLAQEGNNRINEVNDSTKPMPEKVAEIVGILTETRDKAFTHSAQCVGHISDQIRTVLVAQGVETSPQAFAAEHGVGAAPRFAVDLEGLKEQVGDKLHHLTGTGTRPSPATSPSPTTGPSSTGTASAANPPSAEARGAAGSTVVSAGQPGHLNPEPNDLAHGFPTGNHAGAVIFAGAEALSTAAASPAHTAAPPLEAARTDTPISHATHPSSAAAADSTHMGSHPVEVVSPAITAHAAAVATTAAPPPAGAGPVARPQSAGPPSAGPPSHGPGSLPAYGADRTPPTPAATPGSAPLTHASVSGPAGHPAVLRQQPTTATASGAGGLTERAAATTSAATVSAATAGAARERAAAEDRLRRILNAVARQQPRLHWAAGVLGDGTTLLVTDLAGGWIPPHIDIPTGVRLLRPAARSRSLAALLGNPLLAASYQPGQPIGPADESVQHSDLARDTEAVDDLGWELAQATRWRDGLPRLAHTLAKVVAAKTGCLDSEVELLREHLETVTTSVLSQYPAAVDSAEVGNWQLLATIEALLDDEKTLADYHFAWFRAQVLTPEGRR